MNYVNEKKVCKSRLILNYFGETPDSDCGICSYCISKETKTINTSSILEKIIGLLKMQDMNSREIQKLTKNTEDDIIFALQQLLENDSIAIRSNNKYTLKL
ncbi:RecQ family zinc-binding domain-containing protein [Flavobacterium sp. UBA6046]|uniref:RecQ family zinc-binding domain-containing protein n=1 Tax=Flavobacterium sp. UBA6046 TaxID=1946552 RepID=UPI0025BC4BEA|nr:RecQ family zinc-binding domain-containing protein [Flavobacterium sp. UBA6046]